MLSKISRWTDFLTLLEQHCHFVDHYCLISCTDMAVSNEEAKKSMS